MLTLSFLVIGAQKAGTSSLASYLRVHPQIAMADVKEAHFFDDPKIDWNDPDYSLLHRRFPDPNGCRLRGEATPITIYWRPAHERIVRYNPNIKMILLVRDPAIRALSHWQMSRAAGLEPLDFSTAIRQGRARVATDPEYLGLSRVFSYVERGMYGQQLVDLLRWFSRDQVLIVKSECFFRDPSMTLGEIYRFLKIDEFAALPPIIRLNAGSVSMDPGQLEVDMEYLQCLYRDDLAQFSALSGLDTSPWITAGADPRGRSFIDIIG